MKASPQGLAARLTGTINVTLTTNRLPHADIEGNFASLLICRNSWHMDLNPPRDSVGSGVGEGGPYVWVKLAFGRAAAAVVATMYWVDNPIWLAGTLSITAMAAFSTFFVNLSLAWEYVFGLLFIWLGIASVIMALKFGKWVATIGAAIRVFLIAFFTLTVLIYAGEHGLHGFGAGA